MSFVPKNANGQAPATGSEPVVIATEQEAILTSTKTAVEAINTANGAIADAEIAAGATGSMHAKIRLITSQADSIKTAVEAINTANGAVSDAAIAAGATGSIHAKLRLITSQLDAIKTSVELMDDAIIIDNGTFTDGTTKLKMGGYIFDETAGTALTENDAAAARIDSKRAQITVLEDGTTRGLRQGVVDETGTNAVDAAAVGGGTPHDSVDSGNPVKIGAKAIAHGTNPSAVAAADRTDLYANRHGIPFSIGGHPNIKSAEYITTGAQTDDNILPAISTGTKYVITSISVVASAANTVSPSVRIGFGATTLTSQGASGADAVDKIVLSHPGMPAGSGIVKGNGSGIVGIGGDGEELRITNGAPTTGSLVVQVDYYTIES